MDLLIVTGLSGAGKSLAVHALEDMGYFCIDNIPAGLLASFARLTLQQQVELGKVAMVLDSRGCRSAEALQNGLDQLRGMEMEFRILFLDASDEVLERRYQETRRRHPLSLALELSTEQAIQMERQIMAPLFERADYIVDTSLLSTAQLRERIVGLFLQAEEGPMALNIMSFGFKYGSDTEADLVVDVRCLPNPFYVEELKDKTGLDREVRDYVMASADSREFFDKLTAFIDCAVPLYAKEGKSQLVISVGCTGGKHRSVTFAQLIGEHLISKNYNCSVTHRDIHKY